MLLKCKNYWKTFNAWFLKDQIDNYTGTWTAADFVTFNKELFWPPEVFLGKGILKICNKFTGEHPCQSVTSIKLLSNFVEIMLHIFRALFPRNTSGGLLLVHFSVPLLYPLRTWESLHGYGSIKTVWNVWNAIVTYLQNT